jgi:glutamine synthetase
VDAQDVLNLMQDNGVEMLDLRITDLLGRWHHFTLPAGEVGAELFSAGVPFDGSSLVGFRSIDQSDMVVLPDPSTALIDPFAPVPTVAVVGDVVDPGLRPFSRDPRSVAARAEQYLRASGIADVSYWGPELEFFLFDGVRYGVSQHEAFYALESDEGWWSGRDGRRSGYEVRPKAGYAPLPPTDSTYPVRTEIVQWLIRQGVRVEMHHHEVATAGQQEIDLRYQSLRRQADTVMLYKYTVKNTAFRHGKTATFMPKPLFGDNGSGMHVHQSLWRGGEPLFHDSEGYGGMSALGLSYLAGILAHAPALLAITNPTTNSYKRLVPGYEAPVNLVYSLGNRSAAVRLPVTRVPEAKRIEFRTPDPAANPYLAFAAILMAGIDGVRRGLNPTQLGFGPVDKNIYELGPEERAGIQSVPGSLADALSALEKDHDFLLAGGVFTEDLIEAWLTLKRTQEVEPMALHPHPLEFQMYFDA